MKRMLAIVVGLAVCVFLLAPGTTAYAADKDMTIAPLRTEKTLAAGRSIVGRFTVTNDTKRPMEVNLSVKQFSVKDYSYDYTFRNPDNKWLTFQNDHVTLQPNGSKEISYTVTIPSDAAPGGYYFSMIASTTVADAEESSFPVTIQLGSLLYLTVDGTVTKKSQLEGADIAFLQFGHDIPYRFDVRSTGNTHFTADFFAQVDGLGRSEQTYFLLPETVRRITGSVQAPAWPGFYSVTYGYQADFMASPTIKTVRILYIPPWFGLFAAVLILLAVGSLVQRVVRRRSANSSR